jgi:hypothetical protein
MSLRSLEKRNVKTIAFTQLEISILLDFRHPEVHHMADRKGVIDVGSERQRVREMVGITRGAR